MSKKRNYAVIIGLVGIAVSAFFSASFTQVLSYINNEILNSAEPVPSEQPAFQQFCPAQINFAGGSGEYTIYYRNMGGNDGSFNVTLSSTETSSRELDSVKPFSQESSITKLVGKGDTAYFSFQLNSPAFYNMTKLSVTTSLVCVKGGGISQNCGNAYNICHYVRDNRFLTQYNFTDDE